MKAKTIATKNNDYQKWEVLKSNRVKRYKYNEFIVEGVRNIEEAQKNNWDIQSFLFSYEKKMSSWARSMILNTKTEENYELSSPLMEALSGKTDTSELMAVVRMKNNNPSRFRPSECPLYIVFDRPSNKGNLGTLIRSCDALGADGLIVYGHAVDLYDPECVVASMGSFFNFPTIRVPDTGGITRWLSLLREKYPNLQTVATTAHAKKPLPTHDFEKPTVLFIGNETDGLCNALYEMADVTVSIPMAPNSAATSFNVSCAATVMIYEVMRNRLPSHESNL